MTPIRPEPARHGRAHHGRLHHGGLQHDGQEHDGPVPRDAVSLDPVLLDDAALESLAASLLCDEAPPAYVHELWRRDHGAHDDADDPRRNLLRAGKVGRSGEAGTAMGTRMAPVLRLRRRFSATAPIAVTAATAATAAAAAAVLLVAGAGIFPHPWTGAGDGPSQSQPAQPDIDLAALGPAAGAAMGERDLGGLDDPGLADACLATHDETPDALLGAAPMAHGERVGQLFVLSTGIPGRVTVLLTLNTCGSEPGPPVVHEQIGAPG
ncbi:hypothetical protein [Corynebacterium xerosis]|uniref:hypothetical protein n=1 Tax=Corynebacterium xerosis TaxID=1725 RepID=UPI0013CEFEB8|nr:hypothetical protein [Corynebacterium xerosis]